MESQQKAAGSSAEQPPTLAMAEVAKHVVEPTMGDKLACRRTVEQPSRHVGGWLSRESGVGRYCPDRGGSGSRRRCRRSGGHHHVDGARQITSRKATAESRSHRDIDRQHARGATAGQ